MVQRHFFLALLALVGAAGALAQAPRTGSVGLPAGVTAQQRADFEQGLFESDGNALFRKIKASFPADYEAMVVDLLRQVVASGGKREVMEKAGFNAIQTFYKNRMSEIVNAPAALLNAQNARELDLLRGLSRHDPALCHKYATTGFDAGTAVPADMHPLMARAGMALIDAAEAGAGRPVDPRRGQLSQSDGAAWLAKMAELDPSEGMASFLSGNQIDVSNPGEGCRIGLKVYEAIAALPSEQSARITAFIIKSSLAANR
jgi:hypothetical protein